MGLFGRGGEVRVPTGGWDVKSRCSALFPQGGLCGKTADSRRTGLGKR